MSKSEKTIVLLSGGLDSVTALYYAHKNYLSSVRTGDLTRSTPNVGSGDPTPQPIAAISFDYGSKHNHKELPFAEYHCKKLGVTHSTVKLDFIDKLFSSSLLKSGGEIPEGHYADDSMRQTVVPFRNGIMLSIAAGYAESIGANSIVIAAHAGDHSIYPDCREDYMRAMDDAIAKGTYAGIHILRPFISMTKAQIVTAGIELGIDYTKTWSCYKGGEIHCGRCGTCVERREAFNFAGVEDSTKYEA